MILWLNVPLGQNGKGEWYIQLQKPLGHFSVVADIVDDDRHGNPVGYRLGPGNGRRRHHRLPVKGFVIGNAVMHRPCIGPGNRYWRWVFERHRAGAGRMRNRLASSPAVTTRHTSRTSTPLRIFIN
jgi:hypothetical protein